jgi:uncharacterized protein (DUF885 family)
MKRTASIRGLVTLLASLLVVGAGAIVASESEQQRRQIGSSAEKYIPDIEGLMRRQHSELRDVVDRYMSDRAGLQRRFDAEYSPFRRTRMKEFYNAWRAALDRMDFERLGTEGRVDFVLFQNRLAYELALLDREEALMAESAPMMPFSKTVFDLLEARRRMEPVDPAAAAATLASVALEIDKTREAVLKGVKPAAVPGQASVASVENVALRTSRLLTSLGSSLEQWYRFYAGYDPLFTWWTGEPYKDVDRAWKAYVRTLREQVVGIQEGVDEPIVGDPIGRQALMADLRFEMIQYTPEELVKIAEREFAWCEAELLKASREMGFGDDWKAAQEKVKTLHVEPGRQRDLIRDMAFEAIDFVEERQLLTVPSLARDIWRIEMMSPERQKVAPFFLGGEVIRVAFPTDTMAHEDKLMSLRGNNRHFSRAVVQHELIPGHHLQGFMTERYNSHRRAFSTPFWGEGWALYWEMLLWDLDFPLSPEDKVGMLFWRMHRAARIIFSLNFHLGVMTPQECIDFLVDRVGHERATATAEVRRSFEGAYPPLYQVAYMIGGLQFRALERELVSSKKMTYKEFHDRILELHRIPVEMVRVALKDERIPKNYRSGWRFAD